MTAKPHPKVITIHPEFSALDFDSRTPATTPSPSTIRIAVPIHSEPMMLNLFSLLKSKRADWRDTIRGHSTMSNQVLNSDTWFVNDGKRVSVSTPERNSVVSADPGVVGGGAVASGSS